MLLYTLREKYTSQQAGLPAGVGCTVTQLAPRVGGEAELSVVAL